MTEEMVSDTDQLSGRDDDDEGTPPAARHAPKRPHDDTVDAGVELQRTLTLLSAEFSKGILAKRRRMEKLTTEVTRANQNRVTRLWSKQQEETARLVEAMTSNASAVVGQWETDAARMRHGQEKIGKIVTRQFDNTLASCDVMEGRVKRLEGTYRAFMERREELQAINREEMADMRRKLDTQLGSLQKKMVADIHKEDIDNMKKRFKTFTCL